MIKFSDIEGEWPTPPEDPFRDRSLGEGECPCYARIHFGVVGGDVSSAILRFFANLVLDNPDDKELYHCALEVQCPDEEQGCIRYIIELTDHVSEDEAGNVGQILSGHSGGIGSSSPGFEYGIRLWPNGEVNGGGPDAGGQDPYVVFRDDCDKVKEIVELARQIPTNDYSSEWTSNSIIFWLLERAGCDTSEIPGPGGGITPSRANGAEAGRAARRKAIKKAKKKNK